MTTPSDHHRDTENAQEATRDLASRIASAKRARTLEANRASGENASEMSGVARGMRIGTEFIAAILIGAILGYLIDTGLGTSPWGLLIMLMMGFAAGVLNVTRVVAQMNATSAPPVSPESGQDQAGEK